MASVQHSRFKMAAKMVQIVICNHRANMPRKSKTSTLLPHLWTCEANNAGFGQVILQITQGFSRK